MKLICSRGGAGAAFPVQRRNNKYEQKKFFNLNFNAWTDRHFSPVRTPDCSHPNNILCNLKQTSTIKLNHLHSYFTVQWKCTSALSRKCKKKFKSELCTSILPGFSLKGFSEYYQTNQCHFSCEGSRKRLLQETLSPVAPKEVRLWTYLDLDRLHWSTR